MKTLIMLLIALSLISCKEADKAATETAPTQPIVDDGPTFAPRGYCGVELIESEHADAYTPSFTTGGGQSYTISEAIDPSALIDGDGSSYYESELGGQSGVLELVFKFENQIDLSQIAFINDTSNFNQVLIGSIDIGFSLDSTNGCDGQWSALGSVDNSDFSDGDALFSRSAWPVVWVRLRMQIESNERLLLDEIVFN